VLNSFPHGVWRPASAILIGLLASAIVLGDPSEPRRGGLGDKLLNEGSSKAAEAAVARGLKWLALHQAADGHWGLHDFNTCAREKPFPAGKCFTCTCDGVGMHRDDVAATGLALLPFLRAGITHKPAAGSGVVPDYSKTVAAGLNWLMKKQAGDGSFSGVMYPQGIATIALCEAYGLTADPLLKASTQKAIDFIVSAQDPAGGGWRYAPRMPGDSSVTGWQLTALKSAQMAGLAVPRDTLAKAGKFLDSVEDPDKKGRYHYTAAGAPTPSITAVGLLCRQHLGISPRNPALRDGCDYLIQSAMPGTSNNIYYEYYATQMLHRVGGQSWKTWNEGKDGKPGIRDYLIRRQEKNTDSGDHLAGSFPGTDIYGGAGGRIMTTSLSLLCLEVYYRHVPLNRDTDPPRDKERE
jgi:hypothetical protein